MAVQRAEALFDFEPTADVELELKRGDIVLVRRVSVGEGWWEGELHGRRGLFPSSFVKLLPISQGSPAKERPITPITPRTSKKMFMDALLAPDTLTQEQLYDRDKASDLFTPGHADISITVGPAWDCYPPELTVAIRHMQSESRFSGMKHTMVYEVETEQLGTRVARRYRHFLWLYDKLAEIFPCLSLPPLPVKHFSGLSGMEENEARRKGLEKFLIRIARHPVLASTKLFREFLTAKDEKEWKIGRHLSKALKSKKMFSSPFYYAVKYPPFNVPVNQLSSIEKFSRFSRFMESTVQTIHLSCTHLTTMNSDAVTCLSMLGRDFQRFSTGRQPASGAWIVAQKRKHAASNAAGVGVNGPSPFHVSSVAAVASQKTTVMADKDEGSSDEEKTFDTDAQWYWREDRRFAHMAENLHDLGGRMRKFKPLLHAHQESMGRQVTDTLDDYSGIIHTLPMLVKIHEEAMDVFNSSREKDSKKDAEEIRQHCDTLNNILLAEFDYFSKTMIDDFELMTARLLKQQADFHRKLANELEALYHNYTARTFETTGGVDDQNGFYRSRSMSDGSKKSASFLKSGSIDLTSSQESTSSETFQRTPTKDNFLEASQSSETSVQTLTTPGSVGVATYINVELKQRRTAESSGSEIDEDILKPPSERAREEISPPVVVKEPSPSPPPQLPPQSSDDNETAAANDELMPTPFDDPLPDLDTTLTFTEHEIFGMYDQTSAFGSAALTTTEDDTQEEDDTEKAALLPAPSAASSGYHNYANLEFIQVNNLLSQASKSASEDESGTSPKGPKKPMPIQRKTKGSTPQSGSEEGTTKSTTNQESPVRNPILKKPAPPAKPSYLMNQDSESSLNSPKIQQQQQQTPAPSSSSSSATSSSSVSKPHPTIPALSKFLSSAVTAGGGGGGGGRGEERARDDSIVSTGSTGSGSGLPPASSKPRSHTTADLQSTTVTSSVTSSVTGGGGEKKHPILPPSTRYRSKSRSPSPVVSPAETTPPKNQQEQLTQQTTAQVAPKEKRFDEEGTTKESNKIVLGPVPALPKKPVLKAQVSEPGTRNTRPVHVITAAALNRANKPTYGGKFPRPLGGGVGERSNHTPSSSSSNNEQDELMKKLTLRRLKIDEQLGTVTKPPLNAAPSGSSSTTTTAVTTKSNTPAVQKHSPPSLSPQTSHRISAPLSVKSAATVSNSSIRSGDPSSERNSTISTSSSEVIVAYRKLDESPSMTSLSSNGTSYSMDGSGSGGPLLRKPDENNYGNEANLAKYGIIEEGGSYII